MEDLKNFLEMGSFLVTILTALFAIKFKDYHKPIIKRTFVESLIRTMVIIGLDLYSNKEASITDIKNLNSYGMLFLLIYLTFILGDFVLFKVDDFFKNGRKGRGLFISLILTIPIVIVLRVDTSDSNIKFLEDTPAMFVETDGREYEIIIPKDTTIVWNNGSIINNEKIIKNPNEIITFDGEQNKIIFMKSKKLTLNANTIIYLDSSRNVNKCTTKDENTKYNLDFLNSNYNAVQFVEDTKFRLQKDVNISLTQDTLVAIYKKIDKRLLIFFLVIFAISLISNLIFFHRTSQKNELENL